MNALNTSANMTKTRLLLIATLLFAGFPLFAAPVVLNTRVNNYENPTTINVPAGKRFVLKALYPLPSSYGGLGMSYVPDGGVGVNIFNYLNYRDYYADRNLEWLIGPGSVNIHAYTGGGASYIDSLIIYELLDVDGADVATQSVASQVVVIPENATAGADVILESSTDLTNWTAALPGSYSPTTSNRFYRVRLVFR
jgi:hypothetical protein